MLITMTWREDGFRRIWGLGSGAGKARDLLATYPWLKTESCQEKNLVDAMIAGDICCSLREEAVVAGASLEGWKQRDGRRSVPVLFGQLISLRRHPG